MNTEGWQLLTEVHTYFAGVWHYTCSPYQSNYGSQRLLNISEDFGLYLLESLRNEQSSDELKVQGVNIGTYIHTRCGLTCILY